MNKGVSWVVEQIPSNYGEEAKPLNEDQSPQTMIEAPKPWIQEQAYILQVGFIRMKW